MNLKKMRIRANMSQKILADAMNVSPAVVCQWESGVCMPRADKLPALAAALGCTVDELFETGGDDDDVKTKE